MAAGEKRSCTTRVAVDSSFIRMYADFNKTEVIEKTKIQDIDKLTLMRQKALQTENIYILIS